jgi:hypothetical protein
MMTSPAMGASFSFSVSGGDFFVPVFFAEVLLAGVVLTVFFLAISVSPSNAGMAMRYVQGLVNLAKPLANFPADGFGQLKRGDGGFPMLRDLFAQKEILPLIAVFAERVLSDGVLYDSRIWIDNQCATASELVRKRFSILILRFVSVLIGQGDDLLLRQDDEQFDLRMPIGTLPDRGADGMNFQGLLCPRIPLAFPSSGFALLFLK